MISFLPFRNLFRNKRRTIAILLTVALGAGALFSFEGFINGILNQYRDNTIHAHYGHGQVMTKGYYDSVYEEPSKHWITNRDEVETFLAHQKEVEYTFPRVSFSALLKHNGVTVSGLGQGIDAEKESHFFHGLGVETGEQLTTQDDGILLGKGLATALSVEPGDKVTLMVHSSEGSMYQNNFTVTGIFHTGSKDFDGKIFRIQLGEAQKLMKTFRVEQIALGLTSHTEWDAIEAKLKEEFPDLEATSFNVLDAVYYQHSVDWLNAQFRVVQFIIISIVLLGIFNTISTSILERKQEIGNLRANGESIFSIMRLILSEGTLLGFFGSLLGVGLSYAFLMTCLDHGILLPPGPGLTKQFYITFKFEWMMLVPTLVLSIIAAIVASAIAGLKVARMPIANALRAV